jgi:branched-chain amino acid aminotransferase
MSRSSTRFANFDPTDGDRVMAKETPAYLWIDGKIVDWGHGTIHVASEAVVRGESVFEGVRAYAGDDGAELYIFRNQDHLDRLRQSAKIMRMALPYSDAELTSAFKELIRANGFRDNVHFRPTVYFGEGESNQFDPAEIMTGMFCLAYRRSRSKGVTEGVKSCTSTWRRNSDVSTPSRIKAAGNYHNSRLAHVEARLNGFSSPLMLNDRGKVSEGPSSCFMMVRDGLVITPPVTADILESITRQTIIDLCGDDLGLEVIERDIDRTEVYIADEAFFCGSGAEVTPMLSLDHYSLGNGEIGPITRRVQDYYFDMTAGRIGKYRHWLTPVYGNNA